MSHIHVTMDEMPDIEDKIEKLHLFLKASEGDRDNDGGYYYYDPIVTDYLNKLSEADCVKLRSEFLNWEETTLYDFADAISDSINPYLDGLYLYDLIFLKITDEEYLEYLVENIHIITWIGKGRQSVDFYTAVLSKISESRFAGASGIKDAIAAISAKVEDESNA